MRDKDRNYDLIRLCCQFSPEPDRYLPHIYVRFGLLGRYPRSLPALTESRQIGWHNRLHRLGFNAKCLKSQSIGGNHIILAQQDQLIPCQRRRGQQFPKPGLLP